MPSATRARFEAWTHPGSGNYAKRFDIRDALPGSSGMRQMSHYSDETLLLAANNPDIDAIVSGDDGAVIKVFIGSHLIDEFEAARVVVPHSKSLVRQITGPQRNGFIEAVATLPKNYPNHVEAQMHWVWGGPNAIPPLGLGDLGSISETYELYISGERYTLDLTAATAGDYTLSFDGNTTSALDYDGPATQIRSALEALAGLDEISVTQPDEDEAIFIIVAEDPKDLPSNITADFTGITGTATLTKNNDGFDTTDPLTFTLTVDGDTTEAFDWDEGANSIEGSVPAGTGLQGLTTVQDVSVAGDGTAGTPWTITFHNPPNPGSFTLDDTGLSGATAVLTQIQAGGLDPSPVTVAKPIDAGTGSDEEHGFYGNPAIEAVTTPLDTDADWALRVNVAGRYAGSQVVINVKPGATYSNITIRVRPDTTATFKFVIRDNFGNHIAQDGGTLTAGSYQTLTIPQLTIPNGVDTVIVRIANVDDDPANWDDFYVNWQGATFHEGEAAATFTRIVRELLEAGQARGAGTFLEVDATDAADTNGTALDPLSFTAYTGREAHLGQVMGDGADLGYAWRISPAADAQAITPAGTTTHVIQIYHAADGTIEDLTEDGGGNPTGPSVLAGASLPDATAVTRRAPFTTLIALGAGTFSAEQTNATTEANLGRIERLVDADHLASLDALDALLATAHTQEQANRIAARATATAEDTTVPLVDYQEGSKVWWQFPGTMAKQARTNRSIGWVHRRDAAHFQIEGSRILSQAAGMAEAVDMLIRQLQRRRRRQEPTAVTGGGRGGVPRITLAPANASQRSKDKADAGYVATGNTVTDREMFLQALGELDDGRGGQIYITEGLLELANGDITIPATVVLVGAGRDVTFIGFDTEPTITWSAGSGFRHLSWITTGLST